MVLIKLASSACSLCQDTDVSLSEADTVQYIRFIKDYLRDDIAWDDDKKFRVCLLCTHSLNLLKEVVTGIEGRNVKSCICCNSTSDLFKHNDLPKTHKANVTSFASTFNIRGLNICIHCFYAINFWVKLKSFFEPTKQVSPTKPSKKNLRKNKTNEESLSFKMTSNVDKIPEIKQQVQTIKALKGKLSRATIRKFADDKKIVEQVPFVFLTRFIPGSRNEVLESSDDEALIQLRQPRFKKKSPTKRLPRRQNLRLNTTVESSDSELDAALASPVRIFRNRPLKVVLSQLPVAAKNGKDHAKKGRNKKRTTKSKKSDREIIISSDEDDNDYSVTSSGSNTGIVIKRISRSNNKATPTKQKLVTSPLRTIRIQTKKANTSTSSSSTDSSVRISTPRSPVTLPPKKNRKRMMDLSDTDYYEPSPVIKERRSTRAVKVVNNDKKRSEKEVEEVILPSSPEAESESTPKRIKQIRGSSKKAAFTQSSESICSEKDPLEITPSREGSLGRDPTSPQAESPKLNPNLAENESASPNKNGSDTIMTEDMSFLQKSELYTSKTAQKKSANVDNIVSKYLVQTKQLDQKTDQSEVADKTIDDVMVLDSMEAVQGTEQADFDSPLVSPLDSERIKTLDLLACINDDIEKESLLNLELTPEAVHANKADNDTESTLLLSTENDKDDNIFSVDTLVLNPENSGGLAPTASSQSSIYQDAVDVVQTNKTITVLQDISFSSEGDKEITGDTSGNLDVHVDNGSIITEDESDPGKEGVRKRKRGAEDSTESSDTAAAAGSEDDETPRTKRVRFAAERKILNEDDTVCLEDLSEEHSEPIETEKS